MERITKPRVVPSDAFDKASRPAGASHKPKPAKEAAQTSLISPVLRSLNAVDVNSGLSGRVVSEKAKGNKLEQRLQRARSSKKLLGGGIKGSLVDPWMNEVGVKIYPC